MAVKPDPQSQYFGGGNMGLATILGERSTDFFGAVYKDAMARGEVAGKAAAARAKRVSEIKPEEGWRIFSSAIANAYNQAAAYAADENHDPVALQQLLINTSTAANTSMQLQKEQESAYREYANDKRIVTGEAQKWWMESNVPKERTISALNQMALTDLKYDEFLNEDGGSRVLNAMETINHVLNEKLDTWIEEKYMGGQRVKPLTDDLRSIYASYMDVKTRPVAKRDPKTNRIILKGADEMINDGLLDEFLNDPFAKRLIEDTAKEKFADLYESNPEQARAEALRTYLSSEVGGKVDRGVSSAVRGISDDNDGGGSFANASEWYNAIMNNDPEAWHYLKGAKIQVESKGAKGSQLPGEGVIYSVISPSEAVSEIERAASSGTLKNSAVENLILWEIGENISDPNVRSRLKNTLMQSGMGIIKVKMENTSEFRYLPISAKTLPRETMLYYYNRAAKDRTKAGFRSQGVNNSTTPDPRGLYQNQGSIYPENFLD